jgi:hypothetical protein
MERVPQAMLKQPRFDRLAGPLARDPGMATLGRPSVGTATAKAEGDIDAAANNTNAHKY